MNLDEVVDAQVISDPTRDDCPVRFREWIAVGMAVVLADVTVYRGQGYTGYAVLILGAALLLLLGSPSERAFLGRRPWASIWVVGALLGVLVVKMVWCGTGLNVAVGLVLLLALSLALSGLVPYVLEIVVFPARMMLGGLLGWGHYAKSLRRPSWSPTRVSWLSIVLPFVTFVAFSLLFILANPDLLNAFGQRMERMLNALRDWILGFAPHPIEMAFWVAVAGIAVGMLRPLMSRPMFAELAILERGTKRGGAPSPAPFYATSRNTLITVIGLFAVYLLFEFMTLWFRELPDGFYYSGYAHQGAAWLTVALGLATVVLSLVFRGSILHDPRLRSLRRLAWIWSVENGLLAVAVYHRLYIYIGFNGMTRMRIVGILGITSVLIGFLLVVWKIAQQRGFLWLVRRHLWTVAFAVYIYSVIPVDAIVVGFNVKKILAGDSAPSVQISVHEIRSEGVLLLDPLLQCSDGAVRDGIRAYLADRQEQLELIALERESKGWTAFQQADQLLLDQLRSNAHQWANYRDKRERDKALSRFHDYAYRWY